MGLLADVTLKTKRARPKDYSVSNDKAAIANETDALLMRWFTFESDKSRRDRRPRVLRPSMVVDSGSSMHWIGWNVSGSGVKDSIGQVGKACVAIFGA